MQRVIFASNGSTIHYPKLRSGQIPDIVAEMEFVDRLARSCEATPLIRPSGNRT
ncbi:hypothetical protein [Phormidesmis priestleyi]|uniref:hypothetical protein n=1 Tax=Phormidesmis priestleyi TaxID=268141 RepID=UPI000A76B314|nr:hypothetical protein [Phormidesmis priestleyi]